MRSYRGWYLPDQDQHFAGWLDQHPANHYQQEALDLALQHCAGRDLVLDIGANIGLFATRFSTVFRSVLCFEPVTTVHDCLKLNVQHASNITIHKTGLGDHAGTAVISVPADSANCGQYSMVDFAQDTEATSETVPVQRLDDFDLRPDLIKMDVQGYEPWVLRGALQTLTVCSPVLMLEVEGKTVRGQIQAVLAPMGYRPVAAVRHDQIWIKTV